MPGIIPRNIKHDNILIICEGCEEYDYLNKLKTLCINNWRNYHIDLKNAEGLDKIFARYQYYYQQGSYSLVLIFCDTEKAPYEQFKSLCNKIDLFHGTDAAKSIVYFSNPCTMQIILSHFGKIRLKTNQKSQNSKYIEKFTGVKNYSGAETQRNSIMKKLNVENYNKMKQNIAGLSNSFTIVPSTNILELFNNLELTNNKWIKEINKKIEEI